MNKLLNNHKVLMKKNSYTSQRLMFLFFFKKVLKLTKAYSSFLADISNKKL